MVEKNSKSNGAKGRRKKGVLTMIRRGKKGGMDPELGFPPDGTKMKKSKGQKVWWKTRKETTTKSRDIVGTVETPGTMHLDSRDKRGKVREIRSSADKKGHEAESTVNQSQSISVSYKKPKPRRG